jgi:hypothetical protein
MERWCMDGFTSYSKSLEKEEEEEEVFWLFFLFI